MGSGGERQPGAALRGALARERRRDVQRLAVGGSRDQLPGGGADQRQGVRVRGARGERARQRRGGLGAGDAVRADHGDPAGGAGPAGEGDRQRPGGAELDPAFERHRPGHQEQRELRRSRRSRATGSRCAGRHAATRANWYAVVANTRAFVHKYVHQVLAPGVIRENRYRVQAININGKTGPWSNVATLDPTRAGNASTCRRRRSSTVNVHLEVWQPGRQPALRALREHGPRATVRYKQQRLTQRGYPVIGLKLVLTGLEAGSWYRVDLDFVDTFDSPRLQSATVRHGCSEGADAATRAPMRRTCWTRRSTRAGSWRECPRQRAVRVRMGETGKYRVRLKPCGSICSVIPRRIQAPAGAAAGEPDGLSSRRCSRT